MFKESLSKKFCDRFVGPYIVTAKLKDGLYKIKTENGKEEIVNRTHLKKCYTREKNEETKITNAAKLCESKANGTKDDNETDIRDIIIYSETIYSGQTDHLIRSETNKVRLDAGILDQRQDNVQLNQSFHSSLPDLSSISGDTDYLDAVSDLNNSGESTIINQSPIELFPLVRRSGRPRKPPDRLGFQDSGSSQKENRGGTGVSSTRRTRKGTA